MVSSQKKWVGGGLVSALLAVLALTCFYGWLVTTAQASEVEFSLTEEERAWLESHRDLRLGMWIDSPPIMFRGADGEMQGLVPAFSDIVVKKLGLKPRYVRASDFMSTWELAKAGEVDVVSAVTAGPERSSEMHMSEPYLYLPVVVITRLDYPVISGLSSLEGKRIAVVRGHVPHLRIPNDYEKIDVIPVPGVGQGVQMVLAKQVSALVASKVTVDHYTRQYDIKGIRTASITEYSYRVSFGIRKDWPELLPLINRALASISEEERTNINNYWTVLRDSDWIDRPYLLRVVGSIVFVAMLLVGLFVFWNRKLAKEVEGRILAEERFRSALSSMEQVVESSEVIIVGLDSMGRVKLFNHAAEAITGYSRNDVVGQDWYELVVPSERFPYAREEFFRLLNDPGKSGAQAFENPILTKSGETRHIRWSNSVNREAVDDLAVISFGTDITERLLAEEELRLTQFAMDNAAVGICRIRPSGRIVYVNRTAATMLGYTLSKLRKMSVSDISQDYDQETWPVIWQQLKQEQKMTVENTMVRKDGSTFPAEVSAYYLLFKGTELAIGFFNDISERKRVEGLRQDVERMVRHDLRSPTLAVQTLFVMLSRADNLTEDQRELLESVKASSVRMLNIIDMSRNLYFMEEGSYRLTPADVDLLPIVNSIITELGQFIRTKRINIFVSVEERAVDEGETFTIESEEMLCYALLTNLLKNALEASPEEENVELDFSRQSGRVVIRVHNMGVIPESIRGTFFQKYVTLGKATGTGLGTYNAWLITRSLEGEISFETSESGGTTLAVSLPEKYESHS